MQSSFVTSWHYPKQIELASNKYIDTPLWRLLCSHPMFQNEEFMVHLTGQYIKKHSTNLNKNNLIKNRIYRYFCSIKVVATIISENYKTHIYRAQRIQEVLKNWIFIVQKTLTHIQNFFLVFSNTIFNQVLEDRFPLQIKSKQITTI